MSLAAREVKRLSPEVIRANPENPRLIFRQDEMETLADSIQQYGILVPLTVYERAGGNRYVLIDGERRWRCAKKLNLARVPAVIEPKPSRLENILRMFNIHNVRVQWDLMAVALKLEDVQELLREAGKPYSPKDVATITGVPLPTVRRAFDLLNLPRKYRTQLMGELEKPKAEQQFSEDLFIEIMKAMRVMENYVPEVYDQVPQNRVMDAFFAKYKANVITNVVAFRRVSRIARAERAGVPRGRAIAVLMKLVNEPKYKIEDAYAESVEWAYEERELVSAIQGLGATLRGLAERKVDIEPIRNHLESLRSVINGLLRDTQ